MNDRTRILNSLIGSEALLASLFGLLLLRRPVVHGSVPGR